MPKVSIIIATHSRPNLLPRAVESALAAGNDVEVIVVDDASTDDTASVCRGLGNIKYIRVERNQRTAGARNIGILASTAPYIGFLDDDDWRLPGSLDKQVAILDANPDCGLVYGKYFFANQQGEIIDVPATPEDCLVGDLFEEILKGYVFGCLTAIFRKDCLFKVGMLDASMPGIDDWDMWLRIAELYPIMALKEPVAVWTRAEPKSGQGSSDRTKLFAPVADAYNRKWLKLPRAKKLLEENAVDKNYLIHEIAGRILHDMSTNSKGFKERCFKTYTAVKCQPRILREITFYKTLAKAFLQRT